MPSLPVFETLLTIFLFGLVICWIVYLGMVEVEEARRVEREILRRKLQKALNENYDDDLLKVG